MADSEDTDEFAAKSQSFLAWLQQSGTNISTKIELADLRGNGAGRGVLAKEDIAEDEELFSIPRASILTVETSILPPDIRAEIDDPWLGLIAAMVYELQQGDQSIWKRYLDVLPERFDTLMFWSDQELQSLQGSAVLGKIGMASANKAFEERIIPAIRRHSAAFQATQLTDVDLLALCHRMGSTIMAYAFDLEKPSSDRSSSQEDGWEVDEEELENLAKGMVPLADMLNADADRNNAKLFYETDNVVMKSIVPIKAGEEIFNDYGPLPSADVLRRYGYVTSNYAKYDVVEISLELIKECAKEQLRTEKEGLEQRTEYLDEQGILDDAYDIARPGTEDIEQFPEELCILLNTFALPRADFDILKQKEKLPKPTLTPTSAGLLKAVLEKRQVSYPSTAAATATDSDDGSARRKAMARQVVQGEQQVLAEALATLEALLVVSSSKRKVDADTAKSSKKIKR